MRERYPKRYPLSEISLFLAEISDTPMIVDHCHDSGKVRGLLCHPCNAALGFLRDDPVIAAAATEYLRNAKREDEPR